MPSPLQMALGLEGLEFAAVTPDEWTQLARRHDRSDADGIFRSGSLSENHPRGSTDKFNYDPLDTHRGENVEGIDPKEKTAGIDQTYALSIGNVTKRRLSVVRI